MHITQGSVTYFHRAISPAPEVTSISTDIHTYSSVIISSECLLCKDKKAKYVYCLETLTPSQPSPSWCRAG